MPGVNFEIIGAIRETELVAKGHRLQAQAYLRKIHGKGRWRKLKGFATICFNDGITREVELHWYEAHGFGKKDIKIKRYVDET